jgi:putative transposase
MFSSRKDVIVKQLNDTSRYANNRAELFHQPTRVRERGMRKFKSIEQVQRFLSAHSEVYNFFNLGRHLLSAKNYRIFRDRAVMSCENVVTV